MSFPFSVITGKTLHRLIHEQVPTCVEIVKEAYLVHSAGHSINPRSYFLTFPEKAGCRIIALPAYLGERFDVSGIKWISSYPDNVRKGFPRASAVLVLNSYETGYPFACLESSVISAARTAGSAVLAAEHLIGAKKARSLGIVGNGLIARYIYEFFLAQGWELEALNLFDTQPAESQRFKTQVAQMDHHKRVSVAPSVESLFHESDLVVLATVAGAPYLKDPAVLANHPTVLNISLRDLSPELILASNNIVDDVDHVMNANTSVHLTEQQTGNRDFVTGTLAELMTGRCKLDPKKPVIFSPFGLGVLDLAVGKWAYDRAIELGEAQKIEDFFFELTR